MPMLPARSSLFACLALAALAVGCGGSGPAASATSGAPSEVARTRDQSPAAVELRRALDLGDADRAEDLLAALADRLGAEEGCLRARLLFLRGDEAGWLAAIETARAAAPRDPRPYATAAELWAASERPDAARAELERGFAAVGELTPELERAKGALALVTPGGARVGLECLKRAVARDPGLPFVDRAFGQGYLLAAKGALADKDPAAALAALELSLTHDPDEVDARELRAQALYANQRYREALQEYEVLLEQGRNVRVELATWHKNFAVLAQIAGDRGDARQHYLRARELGLADADLGTGVHFLREEAKRELLASAAHTARGARSEGEAARAAAEALDPDLEGLAFECSDELVARAVAGLAAAGETGRAAALTAIEEALVLTPGDRLARVVRGKLLFAEGRFVEAAEDFRAVVDDARAERVELPEPLHLHLSACLDVSGSRDQAKAVLAEYLGEEPEGRWLEETRARLRELGG